jgi:hypothetical protein
MNQLCFLGEMSSSEWAAWVQAIGSVVAILASAGIAIWQSRQQYRTSLEVLRTEHRLARLEAARTLSTLSHNCLRLIQHSAQRLPNREAVHDIADGRADFDLNELQVVEGALRQIPLHGVSHKLVPLTMMVSSTVRQFRENVELALTRSRSLDANAFAKFFAVLSASQESLAATCKDIEAVVAEAEDEA